MMVSGGWEVDRTGSEACPLVDFGISSVKISCSATKGVLNFCKMKNITCFISVQMANSVCCMYVPTI